MPPKIGFVSALLALAAFTASCATNRGLEYGFVLEDAEEGRPLTVTETGLTFEFWPTPAGIVFEIKNTTDHDAILDWNDSYFVQPDGNSYKALNTDVLDEADEVALKSRYSSLIPSNASLKRFTTATVNASTTQSVRISEVGQFYSTTHLNWTPDGRWDWQRSETTTSFSTVTDVRSFESWQVNQYFPTTIALEPGKEDAALESLADQLKGADGYSIGLSIELDGDKHVRRFDFAIGRVFVVGKVEQRDAEGRRSQVSTVLYVLDPANDWQWTKVWHGSAPPPR